jgi:hypothetical protein
MSPSDSDADRHFLSLGVQYYTAARSAVRQRLSPVAGNLYHQAIELLLKARLSHTHSLRELSLRPYGHCLQSLWDAFKSEVATADLDQFDDTITTLDAFWNLRYPDNVMQEGATITFQWDPGVVTTWFAPEITPTPCYHLVVTDIDRLVSRVFQVSSRNLACFMRGMNENARTAIQEQNPACDAWFS